MATAGQAQHVTRNVVWLTRNGAVNNLFQHAVAESDRPCSQRAHTHTANVRAVCCRQHCSAVCGRHRTVHTKHSTTTNEIPPSPTNMFINRTRNHWMIVSSTWHCPKQKVHSEGHVIWTQLDTSLDAALFVMPLRILNEAGCGTIWPCTTARPAFRRSSSLCQAQWLTPVVSNVQTVQPGRYDRLPNPRVYRPTVLQLQIKNPSHSHTFASCVIA